MKILHINYSDKSGGAGRVYPLVRLGRGQPRFAVGSWDSRLSA